MTEFSGYEDGYSVGWEEGRQLGFDEGINESFLMYEHRFAAFWAELQTMNARLAYLEKQVRKDDERPR